MYPDSLGVTRLDNEGCRSGMSRDRPHTSRLECNLQNSIQNTPLQHEDRYSNVIGYMVTIYVSVCVTISAVLIMETLEVCWMIRSCTLNMLSYKIKCIDVEEIQHKQH